MVDKQDENATKNNLSSSVDEQVNGAQSNDTNINQEPGAKNSWRVQAVTAGAEKVEQANKTTVEPIIDNPINSENSSKQEGATQDNQQSGDNQPSNVITSNENAPLKDEISDSSTKNTKPITESVGELVAKSTTRMDMDKNNQSQNLTTLLNRKKKANVRPYDLKVKHSLIPERFAALEIINARFSRQFRVGLFNRLRRNIDVIAHPIKQQTFGEFSREANASHLNLINLHPLRGISLFLFSSELISVIVSNLFGSEGRFAPSKIEDREFTLTEQQVIKRILQLLLGIYQTAWSDIYQIETEYVRSEMQIRFTNITNSVDDIVLTSEFTIEIDGFNCRFCICIPYDSIEPIKDSLIKPPVMQQSSQNDKEWRSSLTTGVKHSTVELVANFAEINTTVNDVLALKINDILKIETPDLLDVTIGGVPVLTGQFGKSNKQYAIQVEKLIGPALDQINEESLNDRKYRYK